MLIEMCKSKIAYGVIKESNLWYEGSITVDVDLLKAANILPGEKVDILNVNNGNRFHTYTIAGEAGSGQICLNGPAARLGLVGDQIMIISYALMNADEAQQHQIKVIHLDGNNYIKS